MSYSNSSLINKNTRNSSWNNSFHFSSDNLAKHELIKQNDIRIYEKRREILNV